MCYYLTSLSNLYLSELFFVVSLFSPKDLKNIADKINKNDTIIDEIICENELPNIMPIIITITVMIITIGIHFFITWLLPILIIIINMNIKDIKRNI